MKKVLIANKNKDTLRYQSALVNIGVMFECMDRVPENFEERMDEFDALILPGGDDIDPSLFRQENKGSRTIDRALDDAQLTFMDFFVKRNKPILGICKGAQVINVYFGGDVIQDLDDERRPRHTYHDGTGEVHETSVTAGNFMHEIYGDKLVTNSFHHQAIGRVGMGLKVIQTSSDGVIEGMIHDKLPITALQWHPERMCFENITEGVADSEPVWEYFLGQMKA